MKLSIFNELDFLPALRTLFKELQVPINAVTDSSIAARDILTNTYRDREPFNRIDEVYFLGMVDDGAFRGKGAIALASVQEFTKDYEGIVIFGVTLHERPNGLLPTRSQLAEISRAFNREFCYTPVVVVFRYAGADGEYLAFANTERSKFKRNQEGEKAGKVTLLRDIDIRQPHSGHERILADLKIPNAGKDRVDSFDKLYKYWQKVLDVSLLNKQFYKEVSTWYFHACKQVVFPKDAKGNQESLIRLITRLMFVWFLKEKGLVPNALFDKQDIQSLLKSLEPQESTYYKAILQNLFFATLNTEGKREFIKESSGGRNSRYMVHNTFRYQDYFQQPDHVIERYFKEIPFLNGGLFECLDRRDENEPEVRIDGFSNNPKNPLSVPNDLFFGELQDVDLNADFGTSRKKYQVRGLVEIFKSYKFTIAENTPFEEDVALDPELLGQVFENLLAAYNPETQTTARKQTGSFYTPREIVNYMVDESLIAYLKNQLLTENVTFLEVGKRQTDIFGNEHKAGQLTIQEQLNQNPFKGKEAELEQKLRQLLSFDDVNPFVGDDAVQERLIKALDNCKILDPACGSGAFPMGVLQKMVHILARLDPHNERWKHQQKEREILPVLEDLQQAQKISYEQARDAAVSQLQSRLDQIEADFANNEKDYPRKLFLIENCIYGVDIQPIALQIAKLRCFISLIVEQKVDNSQPNRGILPLPNLETKFVAANSLIRFSDQMNLRSPAVEVLEKELKEVRQKHFTARSKATKDKYRNRDQELRNAIGDLLKGTGLEVALADSLARWNPYNQNTSADFFDAEWMFGIADGFDIVIGNPPYIKEYTYKEAFTSIKGTKYYQGKMDLWYAFACEGIDCLKQNGLLCFIATNNWITNSGASILRKKIVNDTKIEQFLDFGSYMIFDGADVQTMIILARKIVEDNYRLDYRKLITPQASLNDVIDLLAKADKSSNEIIDFNFQKKDWKDKTLSFSNDGIELILKSIQSKAGFILDAKNEVATGIDVHQDFLNKNGLQILGSNYSIGEGIFNLSNEEKNSLNLSSKELELIKPFYTTDELGRFYGDPHNKLWIIYTTSDFKNELAMKPYPNLKKHLDRFKSVITSDNKPYGLHRARNENFFKGEKIISLRKCQSPTFTYTDFDCYVSQTFFVIKTNRINQKYLTAIFNSSVVAFWLKNKGKMQGDLFQVDKAPLLEIPIPTATEAEQKAIETLVGYVLYLTAALKDIPSSGKEFMASADDQLMLSYFEQIIDAAVIELYLPEELHAGDKYFMRHLLQENLPNIDKIKSDKMTELRVIFRRLFDRDHPIRTNIYFLRNLDIVKIIRGQA